MADITKDILINVDVNTGEVSNQLKTLNSEIDKAIKPKSETAVQGFASIRQKIFEAKNEAISLRIAIEEGAASGKNVENLRTRYDEVTTRVAQLKDVVEDTNARIANRNPDNRLQSLISITQGAVAAVQGVAAAFTLVGVDAENANVAIAKLQGLIALGSALGQVDKIKESFASLTSQILSSSIAQRTNNAATVAATAIQKAFGVSVVGTGAAFKALKAAIITSGLGVLVVALGFAVNAIINLIEQTKSADEVTKDYVDSLEKERAALKDVYDEERENGRRRILELRDQGASAKKIREQEVATAANIYAEGAIKINKQISDLNKALRTATGQSADLLKEELRKANDELTKITNDYYEAGVNQRLADRADREQAIRDFQALETQFLSFLENARRTNRRRNLTAYQIEIEDVIEKYKKQIEFAKRYNRNLKELEQLREGEIKEIRKRQIDEQISELNKRAIEIADAQIRFATGNQAEIVKSLEKVTDFTSEQSQKLIDDYTNTTQQLLQLQRSRGTLRQNALTEQFQKDDKILEDQINKQAEVLKTSTDKIQDQQILDGLLLLRQKNRDKFLIDIKLINQETIQAAQDINQETTTLLTNISQNLPQLAQASTERLIMMQESLVGAIRRSFGDISIRTKGFKISIEELSIVDQNGNPLTKEQFQSQFKSTLGSIVETGGLSPALSGFLDISSLGIGGGGAFKSRVQELIQATADLFIAQANAEQSEFERKKRAAAGNNAELQRLEKEHLDKMAGLNNSFRDRVDAIQEEIYQSKVQVASLVASSFRSLSEIATAQGEQTTAQSRDFALVELAINTGLGISDAWRAAGASAKFLGPKAFFAYPIFAITLISQILAAAARAKNIINAAKPGGSGNTTSAISGANTPPTINTSLFNLPQNIQDVRVTNQPGQDVVRAFITNDELRTNAEKQNFLNKLSSF